MNVEAHIRARLEKPVELWKPEEGDVLVGMVVGRYTHTHEQYGDSPALRILSGAQEWRWHAFGTVASSEVEQCDPQWGDWIGVKYEGQSGDYKVYRVVHVPAQFAVGEVGIESPATPASSEPQPVVPPAPVPSPPRSSSTPPEPVSGLLPGEEPFDTAKVTQSQRTELSALFARFPEDRRKPLRVEFAKRFQAETSKDLAASQYERAKAWLQGELAAGTGQNVEHS